MSLENQTLNTTVSRLFRTAVVVHFACLYVLFFEMRNTLHGVQYYRVAVGVTILMLVIAVLFVTDLATRRDATRRFAKVIDSAIGCVWVAVMAALIRSSMRAGQLDSGWVIGFVLHTAVFAAAVLFGAKLFGRVRQIRSR